MSIDCEQDHSEMSIHRAQDEETRAMRVAQTQQLSGIDSVEVGERPVPAPAAEQALVRVHAAGVGPWDVAFVAGDFPGVAVPFVPGQEVAGVVEMVGEQADVKPGDRVYASLFPGGGGFAELALASLDRLAPIPEHVSFEGAASLVIAAGTAYEGLIDRGRLKTDETVLITAAAGGVGSAAVQLARGVGARPFGVASPPNHDYLRALGATEAFDYHAPDWAEQLLAAVPGGVDVLFDAAGGETQNQAITAVRDRGRVISVIPPFGPLELERGITGEAFAAHINRERLEALRRLVDAHTLHPQLEATLPLEQAREALQRVARRHTRGKIVLTTRQPQQHS
jgi:NADPH:quinone reductase